MPVDPNIPLGVRPVQLENPMNALAQAQQFGLNNLKMQEAEQVMAERNALRGLDINAPDYIAQVGRVNPKLALELQQGQTKNKAAQIDLEANLMKNARNTLAPIQDQGTYDLWRQQVSAQLPGIAKFLPAQFNDKTKTSLMLEADKYIAQTQISASQGAQLALTKRGQDLAYDPALQGRIEEAKVLGKARGEELTAPVKDIQANVKALRSAGYDPETGKDSISDLIAKSTGSFAGAGTDLALRGVGISTGGAKAIAALKTYESKLTQDLLGGKMGAGISNADRDFIVAGIGQIADSTLPVETRQAAWNAVKERMRVAGMVPAPKGQGETGGGENPYAKKTDAEIKKELGL